MASVLADTHAAVWYFHHDARLSQPAVKAMNDAAAAGYPILIASISLVELTYLVENGRIAWEVRRRLISLLEMPEQPLKLIPTPKLRLLLKGSTGSPFRISRIE